MAECHCVATPVCMLALLVMFLLNLCTNVPQEPSDNGPLFSELKFYMRAAKPELSKLFFFCPHKYTWTDT